jgi:hypothetical protein
MGDKAREEWSVYSVKPTCSTFTCRGSTITKKKNLRTLIVSIKNLLIYALENNHSNPCKEFLKIISKIKQIRNIYPGILFQTSLRYY